MLLQVDLLPVDAVGRIALEVGLDVVEQLSTLIAWASNLTFLPLRKRKSTVAPWPAGCVCVALERPQLPTI